MNGCPQLEIPTRLAAAKMASRSRSGVFDIKHKGVVKCLKFIRQNSHQPIKNKNLADLSMLSLRGLQKAFRKHLGHTPKQELQRVRIERARQMLAQSNHNIGVIASLCGYQSLNSFCIAFKRVTGVPPMQYRVAGRNRVEDGQAAGSAVSKSIHANRRSKSIGRLNVGEPMRGSSKGKCPNHQPGDRIMV